MEEDGLVMGNAIATTQEVLTEKPIDHSVDPGQEVTHPSNGAKDLHHLLQIQEGMPFKTGLSGRGDAEAHRGRGLVPTKMTKSRGERGIVQDLEDKDTLLHQMPIITHGGARGDPDPLMIRGDKIDQSDQNIIVTILHHTLLRLTCALSSLFPLNRQRLVARPRW